MSTMQDDIAAGRARIAAVRSWLEASTGREVRLIETHISWVLLADKLAYKFKKPVRLPFLDFRILAARRHFCAEELRLNRRLAPTLYLDVVELHETSAGPRFEGTGPVVDVAVRMTRFPDGALWSERIAAGSLLPRHIDSMARRISDFHRDAAVASPDSGFGRAASQQAVTSRIVAAIEVGSPAEALATSGWPALRGWLEQQATALAPLWEARRLAGRVRECHGDLHLANVLQWGEDAIAFDGIEFDVELRWIDVLDDLAFLVMDLMAAGRRDLAWRFLNACLEASGDYEGVPALRFFLVRRALVRTQVAALRAADAAASVPAEAAAYLKLAYDLAHGDDPRLAITHGLPGSGKTFGSQALIEQAGAIRVRSDVERKRLFGLSALQPSRGVVPDGIYGGDATAHTYARLQQLARVVAAAGWPVVADAAFLRHAERDHFAALAGSLAVPFTIVDCRGALALLRERLVLRQAGGADASEADVAVLEALQDVDEPLDAAERASAIVVDAEHPISPQVLARRWLDAV